MLRDPLSRRPAPSRRPGRALLLAAALLAAAAGARAQSTDAEVRKVDREQGKLTLKHGEIRSLDMPAMTMVFRVADPKMLDGLTEGSRIRFDADKVNGQFTVTRLTKQ